MYAGTTFRRSSGRIVGVHQRIDRVARRSLNLLIKKSHGFPGIMNILHFEGKNGPDGLKLKRATSDIPWHFIDPTNPNDRLLILMINDHIYNLAHSLSSRDSIRAAFEAAWLAHAITDGLTPAHLYSLDCKIEKLFGKPQHELQGITAKKTIHGINRRDTIAKNWEYWGAGGVVFSHLMFELSVASVIASEKYKIIKPSSMDIERLKNEGFEKLFTESVQKIHSLRVYETYIKGGVTIELANTIKHVVMPEIINCVVLAWYYAILSAKI